MGSYTVMAENVLKFLETFAPQAKIIYRSSVTGHADCRQYDKPITSIVADGLHQNYNWADFESFNRIWKEVIRGRPTSSYMDVSFTKMRADGHSGPVREIEDVRICDF